LGFAVLAAAPESTSLSFWFAVIGLLVMSVISTHFIEKPLARRLRKRGPARDNLSPATVT
jgi:peptidoglycan/LPS O-acetylase OafA/YrhL